MYKFVPEIPSIQNLQSLLLLTQRTLPFNMIIPPTFPPSFFSTPIIPTEIYQNINNTPKLPEEELSVKAEEPKALPIQSKKIKKESVKLPSLKHEDSRKKKFWKPHEDAQVIELLDKLGQKWTHIGRIIGGRTGKQVRDRYLYTLNPSINRDKWSEEEDGTLAMLFQKYGNKWRQIALHMPGRTENQIKNRFNSRRKELLLNNSSPDMPQESPTCDTLSPIVKEEVKIEFDSAVGHEKTEYCVNGSVKGGKKLSQDLK